MMFIMITSFTCAAGAHLHQPPIRFSGTDLLRALSKAKQKHIQTKEKPPMANEDFSHYQAGSEIQKETRRRGTKAAIDAGLANLLGLDPSAAGSHHIAAFLDKPSSKILSQESLATANVYQSLIDGPDAKCTRENCPWVEIRGPSSSTRKRDEANDKLLYASVTITGCESWVPLIKRVKYDHPDRNDFLILSGRHGNLPNMWNPKTGLTDLETFDGDKAAGYSGDYFYQGDTKERANFRTEVAGSSLSNVDIQVWDTANLPLQNERGNFIQRTDTKYDQLYHLRRVIERALSEGRVVVMAWCFSLHTFTQCDEALKTNLAEKRKLKVDYHYLRNVKTIRETVQEHFQFVTNPSFRNGNGIPPTLKE